MDEAVIRIDLNKGVGWDVGKDTSVQRTTAVSPAGSTAQAAAFDPAAEAQKQLEREKRRAQVDAEYAKLIYGPPAPPAQFDPAEEAKKRLEREKQHADVEAEYAKLVPPPVTPPFDPVEEARKRLEADKKRQAIDAEYAKLIPQEPPFDPVEEAKKRLEADKKRQEIDAEYAKLRPFDPNKEADHRKEAEDRRKQIEDAYNEKYGSKFDFIKDVVDKLRGTIGAVGGPVAGAGVDIASAIGGAAAGLITPVTAVAAASVALVAAVNYFIGEVNKYADRYGEYSPEIAQAQAMSEITTTLADMRRAQESSKELARYINVQTKLQNEFEDIKVKLLTGILEGFTPILQVLEKIMPEGQTGAEIIAGPLLTIAKAINLIASLFPDPNDHEINDPTDLILNHPNDIPVPQAGPRIQ